MTAKKIFLKKFNKKSAAPTSWEKSSQWYAKLVGDSGHYYHEHVIIPGVLRILGVKNDARVLDVGCGQGILAKKLPAKVAYLGLDAAQSLVTEAKMSDKNSGHSYVCADAGKPFPILKKDFTHATIILALQNMEQPAHVLKNISAHLVPGATVVIVLNHPSFRIPRQSGWDVNRETNVQYRWVGRYMSALKIPMQMHPGKRNSEVTWSFHRPLSAYSQFLKDAGFVIENVEEWVSDKKSTSREREREDTARAEIPLFMCIVAIKK